MWNSGASGDGTDQAAELERPQFVLEVRAAADRGSDEPCLGRHPEVPEFHVNPSTWVKTGTSLVEPASRM
jgi:hypothetical protein